jgi:hypothetical protein
MDLLLKRKWYTDRSTIGELWRDGTFECFTLEDVVRPAGVKVPGRTAIPAGRYQVQVTFSNRFQRQMPLLLNVPNFAGVRIHCGNTDKDTEGCILVGRNRLTDAIGRSREAYAALFPRIDEAAKHATVFITIQDAQGSTTA